MKLFWVYHGTIIIWKSLVYKSVFRNHFIIFIEKLTICNYTMFFEGGERILSAFSSGIPKQFIYLFFINDGQWGEFIVIEGVSEIFFRESSLLFWSFKVNHSCKFIIKVYYVIVRIKLLKHWIVIKTWLKIKQCANQKKYRYLNVVWAYMCNFNITKTRVNEK